jgi:hypothetical protein
MSTPSPAGESAYPLRVYGRLDAETSRWLWLLKWLMIIPHIVVLAFLWIAAFFTTIVAGLAILFTTRYPRAIFDFNVGVIRWTWRVSFYALGAFATDRYPPFSLASDPTYPADLTVEYPDQLSRWLVLVKWWLLALPQYLIVAFFTGGWGGGHIGLIGLLAIVAGVILLFSGTYPTPIFDFVMGLNRWCYRVLAYAVLMTDVYPPFRLDLGGPDTGTPITPEIRNQPTLAVADRSAQQG